MTVVGMLPELQCDHDQLVCLLQSITCQCVVTGTNVLPPALFWYLHSELVGQFDHLGNSLASNTNYTYTATVKVLQNELSSNLSFPAELQSGPLTVECENADLNSNTKSFSIEGLLFELQFVS